MKSLSIKLPDDLDARLASAARRQKTNKSQLVREALAEFLGSRTGSRSKRTVDDANGTANGSAAGRDDAMRPTAGSCLDLAGDLVGCLEGPADLSTNSKYFEGFGE